MKDEIKKMWMAYHLWMLAAQILLVLYAALINTAFILVPPVFALAGLIFTFIMMNIWGKKNQITEEVIKYGFIGWILPIPIFLVSGIVQILVATTTILSVVGWVLIVAAIGWLIYNIIQTIISIVEAFG